MGKDPLFYKEIIDNLYDGVYFVDRNRIITYWNKGAERITGYSAEQVVGRSCKDNLLNHVDATGRMLCQDHCPLTASMEDGEVREADVFFHHAEGHRAPVLVRVAPLRDEDGNIVGAVETFSADQGIMSVRKELKELRQSVHTDALTGIANRRYMEGRLTAALAEHQARGDTTTGVVLMDIDHFKSVNDTWGHDVGDMVLKVVASTFRHNLRKSDVVGRWGGEEFLAVLHEVGGSRNLYQLCEKLRALVGHSQVELPSAKLSVTVSMGATLLHAGDTSESVVKRADDLLYESKHSGRNRVSVG